MTDEQPTPAPDHAALSFGRNALAYDRGRPSYPAEAVAWLVGGDAQVVLELGAGTGKLTAELVAQGHAVHAVEPDAEMLALLEARVPGCSAKQASAEEIPAHDKSVDVVVCATSFHWFDHERALPEIARVLKPGGHVAVVWNERDERIPWVRRLGDVLGRHDLDNTSQAVLVRSELFGFVEEKSFTHWQDINRESIVDLAASRSNIASLADEAREAKLAEVLAFYDDYGRGMDGMQLPYRARCFKAVVVKDDDPPEPEEPVVSDGTDTDMLLIDFR
ncbi:class I SAM-dependent methyltransferase [Nocardioides gansuensis]|uniref:Class I SAM-dependent methyltransferase n=1 Tax=Nocardioides gansuensis TaxID=2138300 RepID=A0A2T8F9M2_9ACTN|nr:class I SAM-dependent methyltransferase [Nocardioides gansuensis]PVG82412.1 class I SAM-dependent methyltransferase [Nocardioides gansuensis]